jgi:hypothetical protein
LKILFVGKTHRKEVPLGDYTEVELGPATAAET